MDSLLINYLIIILILFGVNNGLLNVLSKKTKPIINLLLYPVIIILLSVIFNFKLDFIENYLAYIFFILGFFEFILIIYSLNYGNLNNVSYFGLNFVAYFLVLVLLFVSGYDFNILLVIFVVLLLISFLTYKFFKGMNFKGKISEFLILESILIMIFGLTYPYVKTLNYLDFTPFTILTPNYILVILVILVVALLVCGVLLNDYKKIK